MIKHKKRKTKKKTETEEIDPSFPDPEENEKIPPAVPNGEVNIEVEVQKKAAILKFKDISKTIKGYPAYLLSHIIREMKAGKDDIHWIQGYIIFDWINRPPKDIGNAFSIVVIRLHKELSFPILGKAVSGRYHFVKKIQRSNIYKAEEISTEADRLNKEGRWKEAYDKYLEVHKADPEEIKYCGALIKIYDESKDKEWKAEKEQVHKEVCNSFLHLLDLELSRYNRAIEVIENRHKESSQWDEISKEWIRMKERLASLQRIKEEISTPDIIESQSEVNEIRDLIKKYKEENDQNAIEELMKKKIIKDIFDHCVNRINKSVYNWTKDKSELLGLIWEAFVRIIKGRVRPELWKDMPQIKAYFNKSLYNEALTILLEEIYPGISAEERKTIRKFLADKYKAEQQEERILRGTELINELMKRGWSEKEVKEVMRLIEFLYTENLDDFIIGRKPDFDE